MIPIFQNTNKILIYYAISSKIFHWFTENLFCFFAQVKNNPDI